MKISCIAIDDEPLALDILEDYIGKVPFLEMKGRYTSALQAMEALKREKTDLIFLDIQMPELTGIRFLNTLQVHPYVIFTTAYPNYAVESYEYNTIDYLLKPVSFERFLKAANKAAEKIIRPEEMKPSLKEGVEQDFLFIKSNQKMIRVQLSDILFIKGLKDYVIIHTTTRRIITYQNLKALEDMLAGKSFIRVHRSYIIALSRIDTIESQMIRIQEELIPIGDNYKNLFWNLVKGNSLR
jgi:two-component system, LytTR family, response regulator